MKLIAVVLADESPDQYTDTIALFNYGFGKQPAPASASVSG